MTHRPDRERIIKECEWAIARIEDYGSTTMMSRSFFADVEKLLKEQEAVEPIPPEDEFGLYRCGKCHHQLFRCVDKYCSRCGQAVKWE